MVAVEIPDLSERAPPLVTGAGLRPECPPVRMQPASGVEARRDFEGERLFVDEPGRAGLVQRELEELLGIERAVIEPGQLGGDDGHAKSEGLGAGRSKRAQPVVVSCSSRPIAGGHERHGAVVLVFCLFEERIGRRQERCCPGERVKRSPRIAEQHARLQLTDPAEGRRDDQTAGLFELANAGDGARRDPAKGLDQLQLPEQNLDDQLVAGLARDGQGLLGLALHLVQGLAGREGQRHDVNEAVQPERLITTLERDGQRPSQ